MSNNVIIWIYVKGKTDIREIT